MTEAAWAVSLTASFLMISYRGATMSVPTADQEVNAMKHKTDEVFAPPTDTTPAPMPVEVRGAGRPVALIGGGLTGWTSWRPHAERLADHRTVALLQPLIVQYGLDNRPLPPEYAVTMESAALTNALDGLEWSEPLDLVAWSYGALIALDFALNHPDRIRTLTLIEPPATWILPDRADSDPDVQLLRSYDFQEVGEGELAGFLHAAGLIPPGAVATEMPQWDVWFEHRRSLRNLRAPFDHRDDPRRLTTFPKPVLLVSGHGTSEFLRRVHDSLSELLPDVRSIDMDGGHAPHIVSMDRFLEALAEFQTTAGRAPADGDAPPERDGVSAPSREPGATVGHAVSKDGTSIGYVRRGSGPPLLFVHGTTADHRSWEKLTAYLERDFTVAAMDRRGRGYSGDAADYEFARDVEDVVAAIESIGDPVIVFGHSFGGLSSLEAALKTDRVAALVLYEPMIPSDSPAFHPDVSAKITALVDEGALEAAMDVMLREVALLPDDEMEWYRSTPLWTSRIPLARTIPREMAVERTYRFDPRRFQDLAMPIWLIRGEDSPAIYRNGIETLASVFPGAQTVVLPGQQHLAHHTRPEMLADVLLKIVRDRPRSSADTR